MHSNRQTEGVVLSATTLDLVVHPILRAEAAAALAHGEAVLLVEGVSPDGSRVETVVTGLTRAAQTAGGHVIRGAWSSGRLATEAGDHLLDADGVCFCRDCEAASGNCVDDDE
jgi:hypothetical protein